MKEPQKPKREIKLLPPGEKCSDFTFTNPVEELKQRFYRQKLEDLLNNNIKLLPTMICEMEDAAFLELIRPFVMFGNMKPFTSSIVKLPTRECLESKRIKDYGDLYCLINPN
jgi:hypothetical protein